ncbi:hypothetical protein [Noviherbaspirillum cavernae]|uniref:hypothetical protein n=1 Tax=Noviherbaspirillum cavernae TaxID=2320862 RepID=UPI0011C3A117|nr:hypothetical protein [Noviherbaspirillum cavernae]
MSSFLPLEGEGTCQSIVARITAIHADGVPARATPDTLGNVSLYDSALPFSSGMRLIPLRRARHVAPARFPKQSHQ